MSRERYIPITARLAHIRSKALAHLESLQGWDLSKDVTERDLFYAAKRQYRDADRAYTRAVYRLTPEERYAEELRKKGAPST